MLLFLLGGDLKVFLEKIYVPVLGRPLIDWTILAALQAKCITEVVVSSEDDAILANAQPFGITLIKRPKALAADDTKTDPVILHVLTTLKQQNKTFDYLILLQATSPLRTGVDIDNAFKKISGSDATALISTAIPEHHPLKALMETSEGYLRGVANNKYVSEPRQSLPKAYFPNGAIYIVEVTAFLRTNTLFTDKIIGFPMSREKSFDIDTMEDIKKVESVGKKLLHYDS